MQKECINYKNCPLVINPAFAPDQQRDYYMRVYCLGGKANWTKCKRYMTKVDYFFCPDFVMPDTSGTTDEIIDKYEEGFL